MRAIIALCLLTLNGCVGYAEQPAYRPSYDEQPAIIVLDADGDPYRVRQRVVVIERERYREPEQRGPQINVIFPDLNFPIIFGGHRGHGGGHNGYRGHRGGRR